MGCRDERFFDGAVVITNPSLPHPEKFGVLMATSNTGERGGGSFSAIPAVGQCRAAMKYTDGFVISAPSYAFTP